MTPMLSTESNEGRQMSRVRVMVDVGFSFADLGMAVSPWRALPQCLS